MLAFGDAKLDDRCALLRHLCFKAEQRFVHVELSGRYRMRDLHAAVGVAHLESQARFLARPRRQSTNSSENYVDQQYVTQAQSFATDAVVQGAQVISFWYDETGTRGRQRATYALACLDTNASVAELNNRRPQAYPQDEKTNQKIL